MIIYYGFDKDKYDFRKKAIESYNKTNNVDVGKLYKDDLGKPRLERAYISIADTKNLCVVAISSQEVGIDVERKDRVSKIKMSIKQWTELEAYSKWTGQGVKGPRDIEKPFPKDNIYSVDILDDYYITVCSKDREFNTYLL